MDGGWDRGGPSVLLYFLAGFFFVYHHFSSFFSVPARGCLLAMGFTAAEVVVLVVVAAVGGGSVICLVIHSLLVEAFAFQTRARSDRIPYPPSAVPSHWVSRHTSAGLLVPLLSLHKVASRPCPRR